MFQVKFGHHAVRLESELANIHCVSLERCTATQGGTECGATLGRFDQNLAGVHHQFSDPSDERAVELGTYMYIEFRATLAQRYPVVRRHYRTFLAPTPEASTLNRSSPAAQSWLGKGQ